MYSEAERQIFGPYFNGAGLRYADPLRVNRLLARELQGDQDEISRLANSEDAMERSDNRDRLLAATVVAFDMLPFDRTTGQGALEIDVLNVYNNFQEWLEKNASREPSLPTSPQSTDSPDSSPLQSHIQPTLLYTSPFQGPQTGSP